MILSCPSCSTRYSVPEAALGANGRTVRCAQCAHSWRVEGTTQAPEPPAADPDPPLRSPHRAYRAREEERKRRRRRAAAAGSWATVAAGLVFAISMGWVFRGEIVQALPRTASAYALAGAEVNIYGLVIENPVSERITEDGAPALSVRAQIRNVDRRPRTAPLVRFDLRDASGEPVFAWTVTPDPDRLAPGQTVQVAALLVNPPEEAADVVMTLTEQPVIPAGATVTPPAAGS